MKKSEKQNPVLGFLGFGEAASEIAMGLRSAGFVQIEAYDINAETPPMSEVIHERAAAAGVILSAGCSTLVAKSDIVVSANSSSAAVAVARQAAPFLSRGKLYADINSASPETMREVAEVVMSTGSAFVDVAVMGPVPRSRHKVPLLASGDGAVRFQELMTPYGMVIDVIGDSPGQASAAKLIRSIYMKGSAALLYEMAAAAQTYDVTDLVLAGVCADIDAGPFMEMVTRLIGGTAVHAGRRIHEMQDVVDTLSGAGLRHRMADATLETLQWIHDLNLSQRLGGRVPTDFHAVTAILPVGQRRSDST